VERKDKPFAKYGALSNISVVVLACLKKFVKSRKYFACPVYRQNLRLLEL